jgi:short-subunit dehydrogenase
MNIAVITGASSGMGAEMARQVDRIYEDGIDEIWLIARRVERLESLSRSLNHKAKVISMDLTNNKDMHELFVLLQKENPNIKLLVNASGYGIIGKFKDIPRKEQSGMVRLNCEALTDMTHMALKYMHKGARIIQFASSASFVPQSGFAVYAATKAYVMSFSRALNEELRKEGISVTAVCPGPVKTEFFDIAEKHGKILDIKKYIMSEAKNVVKKALVDAYHRRSVSVYSISMNLFRLLTKILPHDAILFLTGLL